MLLATSKHGDNAQSHSMHSQATKGLSTQFPAPAAQNLFSVQGTVTATAADMPGCLQTSCLALALLLLACCCIPAATQAAYVP